MSHPVILLIRTVNIVSSQLEHRSNCSQWPPGFLHDVSSLCKVSSCLLIFAGLFFQSGEPSPNIPLIWGLLPFVLNSLLKRSLLLEATSYGSSNNGIPALLCPALTCFSSSFLVEGSTPSLGDLVYGSISNSHDSG